MKQLIVNTKNMWNTPQLRPLLFVFGVMFIFVLFTVVGLPLALMGVEGVFPVMEVVGSIVNLLMAVFLMWNWRRYHKESVEKEKIKREPLTEDEYQLGLDMGIDERYLKPFNYKKSRRQIGIIHTIGIAANLLALVIF